MDTKPALRELDGVAALSVGVVLGFAMNAVCSLIGSLWGTDAWSVVVITVAFCVCFGAVILAGDRRWLVWGLWIGTALTLPLELLVLLDFIGYA